MTFFAAEVAVFLTLSLVACILRCRIWYSAQKDSALQNGEFQAFQRVFLVAYLLASAADWLQGPYVYAFYRECGLTMGDIGILFTAGFAASCILGCFVGYLADVLGRRLICLMYCVIYALSCATKHTRNFGALLFGRLLAGVATSILASVFDSWMLYEHRHRQFSDEWTSDTFAKATFGNGLTAIFAGIAASFAVDAFSTVAPFDLAILCLAICAIVIIMNWNENYGRVTCTLKRGMPSPTYPKNRYRASHQEEETSNVNVKWLENEGHPIIKCITRYWQASGITSIAKECEWGWQNMLSDAKVFYCGILQSLFEASMYIFVFMWTPSLPKDVNHGIVFASFMVCMMIGSCIFTELRNRHVELTQILMGVNIFAACSMLVPCLTVNSSQRMWAFLVFEITCGVYFPSYYTLRSQVVPNEGRATILNLYRVPMNAIVSIVCLNTSVLSVRFVFFICFLMLKIAFLVTLKIHLELVAPCKETPEANVLQWGKATMFLMTRPEQGIDGKQKTTQELEHSSWATSYEL